MNAATSAWTKQDKATENWQEPRSVLTCANIFPHKSYTSFSTTRIEAYSRNISNTRDEKRGSVVGVADERPFLYNPQPLLVVTLRASRLPTLPR